MLETGYIVEIKGQEVMVCTEAPGEEKKCSEKGCDSCGGTTKKRQIRAANSKGLDLKIDDHVEIYYPPAKTIGAAFMVLILPLILFFIFYTLTGVLFGIKSELIRSLGGFVGVGAGFLLNFIIQLITRNPALPEVTRKLN